MDFNNSNFNNSNNNNNFINSNYEFLIIVIINKTKEYHVKIVFHLD